MLADSEHDKAHVTNSAVLRELDRLVEDMQILARQKLRGEDVSNWEDMLQFWCERAAQAGYGEK